jgi:tyrosine-protein phosphatase SIW14
MQRKYPRVWGQLHRSIAHPPLNLRVPCPRTREHAATRPCSSALQYSQPVFALLILFLLTLCGCSTGGDKSITAVSNFGQVTPDVWRGGKPSRDGMKWLDDRKVKTIIDLQMDDESAIVPSNIKYISIRVSQLHCDQVDVAAVTRAIDQSPKPVFIHCHAGRDRTGLAVAAWQIAHGATAEEAIADNKKFGHNVWWDAAINRRIHELEQEHQTTTVKKSSQAQR